MKKRFTNTAKPAHTNAEFSGNQAPLHFPGNSDHDNVLHNTYHYSCFIPSMQAPLVLVKGRRKAEKG